MSNDDKTKQSEASLPGWTCSGGFWTCGCGERFDERTAQFSGQLQAHERACSTHLREPEARATYEGLEYVGARRGVYLYVGGGKADDAFRDREKGRAGHTIRSTWAQKNEYSDWVKEGAITHEILRALLGWARDGWTDLPECTSFPSKAGRQFYCPCSHGGGPRYALSLTVPCGRCGLRLAEKPSEAESELREKVLDAFAPMVDAIKEFAPKVLDFVKRQKAWGDMMTDRRPEKGGPILTVAAGRVSLHLDRLSDDRIKRGEQFWEARETTEPLCEDPSCRSTPMEKFHLSLTETWREHHEHDSLWHLERRLQGIRDAHERLGISQTWEAAKVKPAEGTEVDVEPVSIEGTPKPGWG